MRQLFLLYLLFVGLICLTLAASSVSQEKKPTPKPHTSYIYKKDVLPLLQANCNPCHFPGGKVYEKLPFDDSVTVAKLGKKLNTRLKEKEQQVIINSWVELSMKK